MTALWQPGDQLVCTTDEASGIGMCLGDKVTIDKVAIEIEDGNDVVMLWLKEIPHAVKWRTWLFEKVVTFQ